MPLKIKPRPWPGLDALLFSDRHQGKTRLEFIGYGDALQAAFADDFGPGAQFVAGGHEPIAAFHGIAHLEAALCPLDDVGFDRDDVVVGNGRTEDAAGIDQRRHRIEARPDDALAEAPAAAKPLISAVVPVKESGDRKSVV